MNSKQSPSPWRVGMRPGPMIYSADGQQVADCTFMTNTGDAQLIARAPDMQELLFKLLPFIEDMAACSTCAPCYKTGTLNNLLKEIKEITQ